MVICFYCIHQSIKKRDAPTRDLLSEHPLQKENEVSQIAFKWTIPFLLHARHFSFVQMPQNGAVGAIGLIVCAKL
jgi:hypothetical protein